MRATQLLPALIIAPSAILCLPTTSIPSADDTPPQACELVELGTTPTNPPACWAWYASTASPSDYCGASSGVSPLSSSSSPSTSLTVRTTTITTTPKRGSSSWLDACASLQQAQQAAQRDFFLADYATDRFNTLLATAGCALEVLPATAPSSEQVNVGGTDVVDVLGTAIAKARGQEGEGEGEGVEGEMVCSPGGVRWRVVPA
ncbi:hypothetical protein F5B20DRAFT_210357 [Whalleya microplaca]|nr:hypothetical protein F5B20DRAFT_210357 [Whalleya microplaca]